MRDSFVIYRTFYRSIKGLPAEQKSIIVDALFGYALDGVEPNLEPVMQAIFESMRYGIDKASARYDANVKNGKKGGRPTITQPNPDEPTLTQPNPPITLMSMSMLRR
jgi:hypothetical protein